MKIAGYDTGKTLRLFIPVTLFFCLLISKAFLGDYMIGFPLRFPAEDNEMVLPNLKNPSPKPQTITDIEGQKKAAEISGYFVYINLDKKRLFLYLNGNQVRNYPCAGGKTESPSPVGWWSITEKSTWGGGFGGVWMGLDVPYGKYGIHGTKAPWLVGRSHVSKGCIRLISENAKELYRFVTIKTPVVIVYDNMPFRLIRNGDIGPDVYFVQKRLTALGHYTGPFDGRFGKGLFKAVTEFQEENGLTITGEIDETTHFLILKRFTALQNKIELS